MSRLPNVRRDQLSPEHQAIWDRIAAVRAGVRAGGGGPFGVLMHVPALADRVAASEDYFRFNAALPAADRELVILATAREMGARYAWTRHEIRAREAGTRAEAVEAVRANALLNGLAPREKLLVEIAQALLRTRALSDELFDRAMAELGRQQLVEAVVLIGHYCIVGLVVGAFDIPPPDGAPTF